MRLPFMVVAVVVVRQTNYTKQLDPTVRPFVEYGLQEAKQLYQTDTPSVLPISNLCRPITTNTVKHYKLHKQEH
jgi:hypothetical protein